MELQNILGVVRLRDHLKAASSITVDYHPFNIITYQYSLSVYSFPTLYPFFLNQFVSSIVTQYSQISKYNKKYSRTYWFDCYLLIRSWGIVLLCILDVVRFLGHLKAVHYHPFKIKTYQYSYTVIPVYILSKFIFLKSISFICCYTKD